MINLKKRKLYTNDEMVSIFIRCNVIITAINSVIEASDLVDRTIFIDLARIDEAHRKSEEEVEEQFKRLLPDILGCIFNALSGTLAIIKDAPKTNLPRLADFGRWGYSISEVLGIGGQNFLNILRANNAEAVAGYLNEDLVVDCLITLLDKEGAFNGRAADLFQKLGTIARTKIAYKGNEFPQSPSALSRHLNMIISDLKGNGIQVIKGNKTWEISRISTSGTDDPKVTATQDDVA